jgi:hypothetical protein
VVQREPWFDVTFLGEKAEAKDFLVNRIEDEKLKVVAAATSVLAAGVW